VIKAAVLSGKGAVTPLLLSKEFLRQLGTHMDLSSSMIAFERLGVCLRMGVTSRGHFAVPYSTIMRMNNPHIHALTSVRKPLKRVFMLRSRRKKTLQQALKSQVFLDR
jgi:hypothetical protein